MVRLGPDRLDDLLFEPIDFDRHRVSADHIYAIKLQRVGPAKISAAVRDSPQVRASSVSRKIRHEPIQSSRKNDQLVLHGRVFVSGRNGLIPQSDTERCPTSDDMADTRV